MRITKVNIINYKCFEGNFSIDFNEGINIIVGNNETGKSTILEAINLALTGIINGRYLRNELSQYLFNENIVKKYLDSLKGANKEEPPKIIIEAFFSEDMNAKFEGNNNFERIKAIGLAFKVEFDEDYKKDYEELINSKESLNAIPIEYYKTTWVSFSQETMTARTIPIKSALIDSSSARNQNSSDLYVSRIIQNNLDDNEKVLLSQAYRKMKETFGNDQSVMDINRGIQEDTKITQKNLIISAELPTQSAWENALMTFVDAIPFHQIGKGEQCIIKTNLALSNKKNKEAALILLEEPENHLTHTKMSELVSHIEDFCRNKQIIITTHNNFIMNKLNIKNVILLNNNLTFRLNNLADETYRYFKKLSDYPTLRLLLCKKTILVEGESDDLIFQKAYLEKHMKLPLQNGIDVLSVGLAFKRFLDISAEIKVNTGVVTDNDNDFENNVENKYKEYEKYSFIKIFYDTNNELNTLEPQIVNANSKNLKLLCDVIGIDYDKYKNADKIINYMKNNKTEYALKIFDSNKSIIFPEYIVKAIEWCDEK
jgi:putative ATP-dependent endonuclease of OLD family